MARTNRLGRLAAEVAEWLPRGQVLPEDVWRARHRILTILLQFHVAAIFVFALVRGESVLHSLGEAAIVGVFAVLAASRRRQFSSAMCAVGLVMSSAVLVHLSGGMIEMHFHFFVVVGILTLYQDWQPFLIAIAMVVVHHAGMGAIAPGEVYNHPSALAHPFRWALVHGAFVLAASVASVVAWRLNEEHALKDGLTGLASRTLFQDRVGHALARSQRRPGVLAVLFVDLDGFKDVNDTLGHAAGDEILAAVAQRLQACLRSADTAARLGGDEFAVLLEDIDGDAGAIRLAERFLEALARPFELRARTMSIGASIGIALNDSCMSTEELLRNADVAMYTAKAAGRGRFRLFEHGMHTAVVQRVELQQELDQAVDLGQLVLHYQPVVALATGRLAGLEALLRWNHPTRGLLTPDAFLEQAEESGAIVRIGSWVLGEACRQAGVWKERHRDYPISMAVNLSPRQLFDTDMVDAVDAALRGSGLAPADLVLELTESVMVRDIAVIHERLDALKTLGVGLAIDDFGTGYSSLSYLRTLPFDVLKLDKQFIDGVDAGPGASAFALAIIKLAQTLGIETVAEGVERPSQAAELARLGCGMAQGYHFARPLAAEGIDALLAATGREGWVQQSAGVLHRSTRS
ncbi:MAG: putative bifunctional diguanylate cyclase/phosphodiesterase [Actinomycetota bacterium]